MYLNYYKLIRLYYGLSIEQVAKLTGYSTGTISQSENGKRHVSPQVRAAYAKHLPEDGDFHSFAEKMSGMPDNKAE